MIVVTVEKRYKMTTVRARVRASSIERALQLVSEDAHVVFPIVAGRFLVLEGTSEGVKELPSVRNEEVAA
jgi:hypothetical protein